MWVCSVVRCLGSRRMNGGWGSRGTRFPSPLEDEASRRFLLMWFDPLRRKRQQLSAHVALFSSVLWSVRSCQSQEENYVDLLIPHPCCLHEYKSSLHHHSPLQPLIPRFQPSPSRFISSHHIPSHPINPLFTSSLPITSSHHPPCTSPSSSSPSSPLSPSPSPTPSTPPSSLASASPASHRPPATESYAPTPSPHGTNSPAPSTPRDTSSQASPAQPASPAAPAPTKQNAWTKPAFPTRLAYADDRVQLQSNRGSKNRGSQIRRACVGHVLRRGRSRRGSRSGLVVGGAGFLVRRSRRLVSKRFGGPGWPASCVPGRACPL